MDVILKHQIAVAKKTLQMPDEIVDYLNVCSGTITKDEAREILRVME